MRKVSLIYLKWSSCSSRYFNNVFWKQFIKDSVDRKEVCELQSKLFPLQKKEKEKAKFITTNMKNKTKRNKRTTFISNFNFCKCKSVILTLKLQDYGSIWQFPSDCCYSTTPNVFEFFNFLSLLQQKKAWLNKWNNN